MKTLRLTVIIPSTRSHNPLFVSEEHDPITNTIEVECYAESVLLEALNRPRLNVIPQDYGYEELRTYCSWDGLWVGRRGAARHGRQLQAICSQGAWMPRAVQGWHSDGNDNGTPISNCLWGGNGANEDRESERDNRETATTT